ncbi:MAG: hypothetical protein R2932_28255 [Caldilineaceae bacterium]
MPVNPRTVDEDIDASQRGVGVGDQLAAGVDGGEIGDDRGGLATQVGDLLTGGRSAFGGATIDADGRAGLGETNRKRFANAARRAGDSAVLPSREKSC